MQMLLGLFFHLACYFSQKLNPQMVLWLCFHYGGGGGLTPSVAGNPGQSRRCSSSAAEFHVALGRRRRRPRRRGRPSALSALPQTASAGTRGGASETGPGTPTRSVSSDLFRCAVQIPQILFLLGSDVGRGGRVRRHALRRCRSEWCFGSKGV